MSDQMRRALEAAGVPQAVARREEDEIREALVRAGYDDMIEFRVLGPQRVVASAHKYVDGRDLTSAALGLDRIDARRKLVSVITRR